MTDKIKTNGPRKTDEFAEIPNSEALLNSIEHPNAYLLTEYVKDLPKVIPYYDTYTEEKKTLLTETSDWSMVYNGGSRNFKVSQLSWTQRNFLHAMASVYLPTAPAGTIDQLSQLLAHRNLLEIAIKAIFDGPSIGLTFLRLELASKLPYEGFFYSVKSLFRTACQLEWFGWNEGDISTLREIRNPLSTGNYNEFADDNERLLTIEEEQIIVNWFDDIVATMETGKCNLSWSELRDAVLLYWAWSNGPRPVQLAKLDEEDAVIRDGTAEYPTPLISLRFPYVKQRLRNRKRKYSIRKMRREWTPLMAAFMQSRQNLSQEELSSFDRPRSLFGLSPAQISSRFPEIFYKVTGYYRTAYDLRHSAAQRLADSGASRLQITEFLTHENMNSADRYISNSTTQAELINKAMGLSATMQRISKELKKRSLSQEEYDALDLDKKIHNAPNGHFIAGIGGCSAGQSFCTKTPALACYTCNKFMYLRDDPEVHRNVVKQARSIVNEFLEASPAGRSTPAYLQLSEVIETAEAIVRDIEESA